MSDQIITFPGELYLGIYDLLRNLGFFALFAQYLFGFGLVIIGLDQAKRHPLSRLSGVYQSDVGYLVVMSILVFLLRLPNTILPELNSDESQFISAAANLIHDFSPWLAVDTATSGPLNIIPLCLIYYLGLGLNYVTVRLFVTVLVVIPCLILFYFTLRKQSTTQVARLLHMPLAMYFAFAIHDDFIAFNSETFTLLLTMVVILVSLAILYENRAGLLRVAILGLCAGFAPYIKLQSVPIFLCIGTYLLVYLLMKNMRWQALVLVLMAMFPTVVTIVYLLQNNLLQDVYKSYVLANLWYVKYDITGQSTHSWFDSIQTFFTLVVDHLGSLTSLVFVLFACCVLLIRNSTYEQLKCVGHDKIVIYLVLCVLSSIVAVVVPGNRFGHYLFLIVVPFITAVTYLVGRYGIVMDRNTGSLVSIDRKILALSLLATVIVYVVLGGSPGIKYAMSNKPIARSSVTQQIAELSSPGQKMALWGFEPRYFVETELLQGTRYGTTYNQTHNNMNKEYYVDSYRSDLETRDPLIFVDVTSPGKYLYDSDKMKHEQVPNIGEYVAKNYDLRYVVNGVRIFVRKYRNVGSSDDSN